MACYTVSTMITQQMHHSEGDEQQWQQAGPALHGALWKHAAANKRMGADRQLLSVVEKPGYSILSCI